MMRAPSLITINKSAPYRVSVIEGTSAYGFTTDAGVELSVRFLEDDLITAESYQLVISNASNKPSPHDIKVRFTILAIVVEFLEKNQAALLYLCDTSDNKQKARARLFAYWFDSYEYSRYYHFLRTSIVDRDGVENCAAVFVRSDNPKLVEIYNEFNVTLQILREKPQ